MTSGAFETIMLDSIIINRGDRQRKELEKVPELAESIRSVGLINPPVVTREFALVAGERRLEACRSLGWLEIPVQFSDTLDPVALHLIELEENVKRVDLSWQDQNDAIAAYHKLKTQMNPEQTIVATAAELNVSDTFVRRNLLVAKAREEAVDGVTDAPAFSVAFGLSQRNFERKKTEAIRELPSPTVFQQTPKAELHIAPPVVVIPEKRVDFINASFLDWVKNPPRKFNFIHCDFPYGVSVGDKIGQSAAKGTGTYADTPDIYFELLEAFVVNSDKFIEPSAHLMFWFSMNFFEDTKSLLRSGGWDINPFPLIWHKSDNAGILPDKDRGPRRTYETALMASRGDRKIVRPVANSFAAPTTREVHTSEKPRPVLEHFFRMFVDDSSTVLDPTAGSANAIRVAADRGADYALGIELSTEFYLNAKENLQL